MTCPPVAAMDFDAWLAENTVYCKRHRSSITVAACKTNQQISARVYGDLRCQGCEGLNNQSEEVRDPFKLYLAYPANAPVHGPFVMGDEIEKIERLEEIDTSRISETPEPETVLAQDDLSIINDLLLDLDDETLAAITNGNSDFCRELASLFADDEEPEETPEQVQQAFVKVRRVEKPRRYAVFLGRCPRCNGYMDSTRVKLVGGLFDDDVSRCLNCGWHTSPMYVFNRGQKDG